MASICPLPLDCSEAYGRLSIDGWTLHNGAWCAWDLGELHDSPATDGTNWYVEDRDGNIPQAVVLAETTYSIPVAFSGAVDRLGVAWANPAGGLFANRRAFEAHYIAPLRNGTASLPAVLQIPDPDTDGAWIDVAVDVQPTRLTWQLHPGGYARGVLTLVVPEQAFVDPADEYV